MLVPILCVTACLSISIKCVWPPYVGAAKVKGEAVRQMGGIKAKWRTIFTNPLVWAKDTFARYENEPTAWGSLWH